MRHMAIGMILGMLALAGLGCRTVPGSAGDAGPKALDLSRQERVVLDVHGLSCPLCSNNLDGQLKRIAGVRDAEIDLKTGAVTVTLAPGHGVTAEKLARAVADAGFTFKGVRLAEGGAN